MKRFRPSTRPTRQGREALDAFKEPYYPEIRVSAASANPLVLVAEVRQALRHARVGRSEIDRFTEQALAKDDPHWRTEICQHWVKVG